MVAGIIYKTSFFLWDTLYRVAQKKKPTEREGGEGFFFLGHSVDTQNYLVSPLEGLYMFSSLLLKKMHLSSLRIKLAQ